MKNILIHNLHMTTFIPFSKIFSVNQPRQVTVKKTTFRELSRSSSSGNWYVYGAQDVPCPRMFFYGHLTQLIAREYFIEFSSREN
jgi:hypothetical protein